MMHETAFSGAGGAPSVVVMRRKYNFINCGTEYGMKLQKGSCVVRGCRSAFSALVGASRSAQADVFLPTEMETMQQRREQVHILH